MAAEGKLRERVLKLIEMMQPLYDTKACDLSHDEVINIVRYQVNFLSQLIAEESSLADKQKEMTKVRDWLDELAADMSLRMK